MKMKEFFGAWTRPLVGLYLRGATHIDALVLDPPGAEAGDLESLAREVYHRHLAYLLIGRLQRAHIYIGFGALLATLLGAVIVAKPIVPGWVAFVAGTLFALGVVTAETRLAGWMSRRHAATDIAQARGLVSRAFLRTIAPGTPADLADPWRHNWTTADARPLAAELCEIDARHTWTAGVLKLSEQGTLPLVAVAWLGWGEVALVITVGAIIAALILKSAAGVGQKLGVSDGDADPDFRMMPAQLRQLILDDGAASSAESVAWVVAGGTAHACRHDLARQAQIDNATRDKSPILQLGAAVGILAGRGDSLAPTAGQTVAMSLMDLCQHLLITGGTGSGKTSLIRSMVRQIAAWKNVGLLIMDGKAALGAEMAASVQDLHVIDPASCKVSLVEGVTPAQLAEVIQERLGTGAADRFWIDSAAGLLRQGAVIAERAKRYSLANAYRVAVIESFRTELLEGVGAAGEDLELDAALEFFRSEWITVDGKTRSGIVQTLRAVYQSIASGTDLLRWCETEAGQSEVDVTEVLRGGRVAVVTPAYRYGAAGPIATSLLKMRLYNAVKARADRGLAEGETPVVMVCDEFQAIALKGRDSDLATIGRSLGVAMVLSTQTVEHLVAALEEAEAGALLNVIGSHVALTGRSPRTDEMIAKRIGSTFRPTIQSMPGVPTTRSALMVQAAAGARAAARHQPDIGDALSWSNRGVAADLMRRRGFGALQFAREELEMYAGKQSHNAHQLAMMQPICSVGVAPLVDSSEVGELVQVPGSALVAITRGRVARRDVVDLQVAYA